ncbi:MAG: hypothetical protein LBK18_05655, partial [Prevotellaceae bacterium]|nr:hypothetical protein [Prevotellaceae bacterium]
LRDLPTSTNMRFATDMPSLRDLPTSTNMRFATDMPSLRDLPTSTNMRFATDMPSPSATLGAGSTGFTDVNQHAIFCQHCPHIRDMTNNK